MGRHQTCWSSRPWRQPLLVMLSPRALGRLSSLLLARRSRPEAPPLRVRARAEDTHNRRPNRRESHPEPERPPRRNCENGEPVGHAEVRRRRALLAAAVPLIASCATVPKDYPRTESTAFQLHESTGLGKDLAALAAQHPGQLGVAIIRRGRPRSGPPVLAISLSRPSTSSTSSGNPTPRGTSWPTTSCGCRPGRPGANFDSRSIQGS